MPRRRSRGALLFPFLACALVLGAPVAAQAADGWSPVANWSGPDRILETSTLLPDGKVLIAGGSSYYGELLTSAMLYDPATNSLSPTGSMVEARSQATATLIPGLDVVLIAGGSNGPVEPSSMSSTELYDVQTGTFRAGPQMIWPRYGDVAVLLDSGQVALIGGMEDDAAASSELYDPIANTFSLGPALPQPIRIGSGTVLDDGSLLIAGGVGAGGRSAFAHVYPADGTSPYAVGGLNTRTIAHTATRLLDGRVLVAGGYDTTGPSARAELYDHALDGAATPFTTIAGSMLEPTYWGSAVLMQSGEVLLAGGGTGPRTELYDPVTESFRAGPPMGASRYEPQLVNLGAPAGRVLAIGGYGSASAEIYGHLPEVTLTNTLIPRGAGGEFDLVIDGQTVRAHAADGEAATLAAPVYHANVTVSVVAVNGSDPADYALRIDCGAAGAGNGPTLTLAGVNDDTSCRLTEVPPAITVINRLAGAPGAGRFDLEVNSSTVRANAADGEQGVGTVAYRANATVSETASSGTDASRYDVVIDCGAAGHGTGTSLALHEVSTAATCTITNTHRPGPPPPPVVVPTPPLLEPAFPPPALVRPAPLPDTYLVSSQPTTTFTVDGGLIRLHCEGSRGRCNGWIKLATVDPVSPRGALGAKVRFNLAAGENATLRAGLPLQTRAALRKTERTLVRLRAITNEVEVSSLLTLRR